MLTRIISMGTTIVKTIKIMIDVTTRYILGEGFYVAPRHYADKNPEGIGIVRLGPAPFATYIALIQPKCQPPEIFKQLKQFMSLDHIDSRSPYACVNFLTGSDFFLSMHNAKARDLRKNMIRYFDLKKLHALSTKLANQALDEVADKRKNQHFKCSYSYFDESIKSNIFRLFAHGVCGLDLESDFSEIEKMIHRLDGLTLTSNIIPFHVFFPQLTQLFHPTMKKIRNECNEIITHFIKEQIQALRQNDQKINSNIFTDRISTLYPDRSLHDLNTKDIDHIAKDRQIRMTISGLLAASNITTLILSAIVQLENSSTKCFFTRIFDEIDTHCTDTQDKSFMRKDKMPSLHAFYLEMLRYAPPMPNIARYAHQSIKIGSQAFPANSLLIFDLKAALRKCGGNTYPPNAFHPERYLNENSTLNELAKNSQEVLLPFGAGARACPAMSVAELMFKTYLIAVLRDARKNEVLAFQLSESSRNLSSKEAEKEEKVQVATQSVRSLRK